MNLRESQLIIDFHIIFYQYIKNCWTPKKRVSFIKIFILLPTLLHLELAAWGGHIIRSLRPS